MESEPRLIAKEKFPPPEVQRRIEPATLIQQDSESNTLPTELFQSLKIH